MDEIDDKDEFLSNVGAFFWAHTGMGNHAYRTFLPPSPKPVFIEGALLFEHQKRAFSGLMGGGRVPEVVRGKGRPWKGQPEKREIPLLRNTPKRLFGNAGNPSP